MGREDGSQKVENLHSLMICFLTVLKSHGLTVSQICSLHGPTVL